MKQKIEISAITPLVPNFIRTPIGVVPIADVSDSMLRAIAKEWGAQLVKKAQERRNKRALSALEEPLTNKE